MRQRQYTAPIHALSAKAPNAVRETLPASTGGKPTLGAISKRGTTYVRALFIQGAQSSFVHLKRDPSSLGVWLCQVEARRQRQVAVVALANKMVRICRKVLTSQEHFAVMAQPTTGGPSA
jgi:hypothetical protein